MLPIGVIIPTRNSAGRLPRHLASLRSWLDEVQEVVVVDSDSTDGTLDMLRSRVRHPRCKFLAHSPGLYQSWNFAIQHLTSPYTYISTVGDTITLDGLRHLVETGQVLDAAVVLSPPSFEKGGRRLEGKQWTLHQYINKMRIQNPARLPRSHLFLGSVFAGPAGMMGSSASNLYETTRLQHAAFPCDFGHVGDTAWGLMHAFDVTVAVTPRRCATFEIHPNAGEISELAEFELADRLLDLAREILAQALQRRAVPAEAEVFREIIHEYASLREAARRCDSEYYSLRRSVFPWFLRPRAWETRFRRDRFRRSIEILRLSSFRKFNF